MDCKKLRQVSVNCQRDCFRSDFQYVRVSQCVRQSMSEIRSGLSYQSQHVGGSMSERLCLRDHVSEIVSERLCLRACVREIVSESSC